MTDDLTVAPPQTQRRAAVGLESVRRGLEALVSARVLCELNLAEQARYAELCHEERALLGLVQDTTHSGVPRAAPSRPPLSGSRLGPEGRGPRRPLPPPGPGRCDPLPGDIGGVVPAGSGEEGRAQRSAVERS